MEQTLKTAIQGYCQKANWFGLLSDEVKKQIEHAQHIQLDMIPLVKEVNTIRRLFITNYAKQTTLVEVSGFQGHYNVTISENIPSHISH